MRTSKKKRRPAPKPAPAKGEKTGDREERVTFIPMEALLELEPGMRHRGGPDGWPDGWIDSRGEYV